jgi:hypothetical protein
MWVEEMGRAAARSGPLGIADVLCRALTQDASNPVKPTAASAEDMNGRRSGAAPAEDAS